MCVLERHEEGFAWPSALIMKTEPFGRCSVVSPSGPLSQKKMFDAESSASADGPLNGFASYSLTRSRSCWSLPYSKTVACAASHTISVPSPSNASDDGAPPVLKSGSTAPDATSTDCTSPDVDEATSRAPSGPIVGEVTPTSEGSETRVSAIAVAQRRFGSAARKNRGRNVF